VPEKYWSEGCAWTGAGRGEGSAASIASEASRILRTVSRTIPYYVESMNTA